MCSARLSNYLLSLMIFISLLASGCVGGVSTQNCFTCSVTVWNEYGSNGGEIWQHKLFGNYSDVMTVAYKYCSERGVKFEKISSDSSRRSEDVYTYKFECKDPKNVITPNSNTPTNQPSKTELTPTYQPSTTEFTPSTQSLEIKKSLSIEEAKKACIDLGFKSGTERFGQCTLQLSR